MYTFAKIVLGFYIYVFNRIKIIGKENIAPDGALIVYGNHQSIMDIFCLNLAFGNRKIIFMAKNSLFKIPIIKSVVKAYGAFPVDRSRADLSAIKNALRVLKEGKTLGIFPEGTRIASESDSDAKGGIAMIAEKTKATLQPVRIIYKRKKMIFNSMTVIIGKSFSYSDIEIPENAEDPRKAAGKILMEKVYELKA
ncbi:MAG: 1-acyl-sn-glycerol-3-phosphate acyltransferase [Clostridia bacterium]|nr:1-acyl-sn-glycerol-3-phosphate acyltransferase [Clostridia bacterium]